MGATMFNPLVSVVFSVVNRPASQPASIERTIASVCSQTHGNLQILVVGATEGLATDDPRLEIISKRYPCAAVARNEGMRAARGDFVAFIDSDTEWRPWKIEAQLRCLEAIPKSG